MSNNTKLPLGQYELDRFSRVGLSQFANRFPKEISIQLKLDGDVETTVTLSNELKELPRVDQISDFHCATTWTRQSLQWSGFRFSDFFMKLLCLKLNQQKRQFL